MAGDVDSARIKTLVEAARASTTAANFGDQAISHAHEDGSYALTMATIAVLHQLLALTLTIEAATLEPADVAGVDATS